MSKEVKILRNENKVLREWLSDIKNKAEGLEQAKHWAACAIIDADEMAEATQEKKDGPNDERIIEVLQRAFNRIRAKDIYTGRAIDDIEKECMTALRVRVRENSDETDELRDERGVVMKKPEYKQNIIVCKKCGGTNTRVFEFPREDPEPIWYIQCECGIITEWPHEDFTAVTMSLGVTKSDPPPTIRLDVGESQ